MRNFYFPALGREKGMVEQEEQVGFDWKIRKPREEPPSLPGAPGILGTKGKNIPQDKTIPRVN